MYPPTMRLTSEGVLDRLIADLQAQQALDAACELERQRAQKEWEPISQRNRAARRQWLRENTWAYRHLGLRRK